MHVEVRRTDVGIKFQLWVWPLDPGRICWYVWTWHWHYDYMCVCKLIEALMLWTLLILLSICVVLLFLVLPLGLALYLGWQEELAIRSAMCSVGLLGLTTVVLLLRSDYQNIKRQGNQLLRTNAVEEAGDLCLGG
jgi:hypothetical protein